MFKLLLHDLKARLQPIQCATLLRGAGWIKSTISIALLAIGIGLVGNGGYMIAKAQLAQQLLAYSWKQGIESGSAQKPWSWADTEVAARIRFLSLDEERYVMRDASGESLAFGPGFVEDGRVGQTLENIATGTAIAGHRDSHFGLLRELKANDIVELERLDQSTTRFRVTSATVIDTRYQILEKPSADELTLITCYPFDSMVPGGPLRYVVFGIEVPNNSIEPLKTKRLATMSKSQNQAKQQYATQPTII
ncbi:MAG: class GN sortase [Arenicella sp.]|nr:class GN sortase [Arenicella sp.]